MFVPPEMCRNSLARRDAQKAVALCDPDKPGRGFGSAWCCTCIVTICLIHYSRHRVLLLDGANEGDFLGIYAGELISVDDDLVRYQTDV